MSLTNTQREAVAHLDSLSLVSCPGSGKTRTLVAKLASCVAEVLGTPRMIACITYTNAAVHEIESRLERLDVCNPESACEVETIHSFCLKHIFGTHGWRLPPFRSGFRLLTPDEDEFATVVKGIAKKHGLSGRAVADFEQVTRGVSRLPDSVTADAAQEYWDYLDAQAATDFSGIIYWSKMLVEHHPFIARGLGSRYAWFLVDEFQDTSDVQVAILKTIHRFDRSRFFIVGDPYQSIMSVNGANPTLMDEFADHVRARRDLELLGNFRSTRSIIRLADAVCDRGKAMEPLAAHRDFSAVPEWHAVPDMETGILEVFLPALARHNIPHSDAAILAPWWTSLPRLARTLRANSISVLGPGARPYRRSNHVIAPLVEELAAAVAEPLGRGIRAVRRELRGLLTTLSGGDRIPSGFAGDVVVVDIMRKLRSAISNDDAAQKLLAALGEDIASELLRGGFITGSEASEITSSSGAMITDINRNESTLGLPATTVQHLGMFSKGSTSLRLSTMHGSKGREWAAVALIEAYDGRIPHFTYQFMDRPEEERTATYEEGRRVFYVALTRAKRILMIFTLDQPDKKTQPSPFLVAAFPAGPMAR